MIACAAVFVMKLFRSVYRNTDQPAVVAQKPTPFVVEQRAVGLQTIFYVASSAITTLQFHRPAIEIKRPEHSLASVPDELHIRY